MTYLSFLQWPANVAIIEELYAFGVISNARYTHSQILLAYIDMRQQDPKICDIECAYRLSKNPQYLWLQDIKVNVIASRQNAIHRNFFMIYYVFLLIFGGKGSKKKSHMRKGYAIFLFGCVLFEEVVSCMQEVVSLREVLRLWRVTATK